MNQNGSLDKRSAVRYNPGVMRIDEATGFEWDDGNSDKRLAKHRMKKPIEMPEFENEDEERDYWDQINLADYYEPDDGKPVVFPNLKPTTRPISIHNLPTT